MSASAKLQPFRQVYSDIGTLPYHALAAMPGAPADGVASEISQRLEGVAEMLELVMHEHGTCNPSLFKMLDSAAFILEATRALADCLTAELIAQAHQRRDQAAASED